MQTFKDAKPTEALTRRTRRFFLSGFQSIPTRFRKPQADAIAWLIEAHVRAGGVEPRAMELLFSRYSASPDQIATRGHELEDFARPHGEAMRLFGPGRSTITQKTDFFQERVNDIFERYYPADAAAPDAIVHVTCTGYCSPSGAQQLVSLRNWGKHTEVVHAYHMGCYAAHPAIRMGTGLAAHGKTVNIVHTELCSLHLDPTDHDPAKLIIQSLFADGFMKYQLSEEESSNGFEILSARDEIVPDSINAMRWTTGPMAFSMALTREVPTLLAGALPRFAASLCESVGLDWVEEKPKAIFAVHPGGPRIIELSERILGLEPQQVRWSRHILREHGNMSSATLPHIWQKILQDDSIADGTLVISLGAGPGLTLSGMLFRKYQTQA